MGKKVLVIGSGGREHCLAWKLRASPQVDAVYCAPGNGGTSLIAKNVGIPASDTGSLLSFARDEGVDLTVVGPEAPLVSGIVDSFNARGLCVFGPRQKLADLEGSKIAAKQYMRKFGIPTAEFEMFQDPDKARAYIRRKGAPCVVKADGLAAGKGVVVAQSEEEAYAAIEMIMCRRAFGDAGRRVIIEECLEGEEASVLIFSDGEHIVPLVSSQDHKRALENDCGPNTGGMGAYAPAPVVTEAVYERVMRQVCVPLIEGLHREGTPYKGMLYAGLMIKDEEPSVLEFNVRFGDPETQAVLPKLESDLFDIMIKTAQGRLKEARFDWDRRSCVCVVLASGGYPAQYKKGVLIQGLGEITDESVHLFHAGTRCLGEYDGPPRYVTAGGRVLNVCALGDTLNEAREKAYAAIGKIHFEGMHFRRDIGAKALGYSH